jgi:rhodanese-related sulfurtransferase
MPTIHTEATIDVRELCQPGHLDWQYIDVRSPTEFATGHIPAAVNIPIEQIQGRIGDLRTDHPIVLVCQSGTRAAAARDLLAGRVDGDLYVLSGGTNAWKAAGQPLVASTQSSWSLERQVRLVAGTLVLTGILLGYFVHPGWLFLSGFVGCSLVIAGFTNFCLMGVLLAHAPWNQPGGNNKRSTGAPR